jgi:hypothetical protein
VTAASLYESSWTPLLVRCHGHFRQNHGRAKQRSPKTRVLSDLQRVSVCCMARLDRTYGSTDATRSVSRRVALSRGALRGNLTHAPLKHPDEEVQREAH